MFLIGLLASPALADGDAVRGAALFAKCQPCHAIAAPDGKILARGGRIGPNLFGLPNRRAGSLPGYRYGAALQKAGEEGLIWDEASFAAFIADPRGFLGAVSKMTVRQPTGGADLYAYLQEFTGND